MVCPSCHSFFGQADARFCGACGQQLVDPYAGLVLNNRFQLETKIGEGSFGVVFRGTALDSGRAVAVKLLHPELNQDANRVARFRQEGLVLCNLRNAHTITVFDFDQADGMLYIAMELLEGKSLEQTFYEEAPLEWRRVFRILIQICSSLGEAHAQGIVHRDLKPENIYLEDRARNHDFVKVLDFGIAKLISGDPSNAPMTPQLTAIGQTLGTLEYMAPEQLMGKALDGRSDIYALGVLGYELITGALPFPNATDTLALITAQLKHRPMAPSQLLPASQLPPAGDAVILKCLERDKRNRFADAMALAAALQEVVGR